MEEKKTRQSKKTIIDKETGIISGQRPVVKVGDSFYINIPKEFMESHHLKKGSTLTLAANSILKYIPSEEI